MTATASAGTGREPAMTVAEAWMAGREHLVALGVEEAGITAEVLLRHALRCSRTDLYLAWHRTLPPDAWDRYRAMLEERARGRPVAYITGRREFMGLEFLVDERVLIPRPETEVLVETVLEVLQPVAVPLVVDVGTGSGAIAVSLAAARPDARVLALDVSAEALAVARANTARHGVAGRVALVAGDVLTAVARAAAVDAVVSNPPYVDPATAATLPKEIREFEPAVAVISPQGGEWFHARLAADAPAVLRPGGWLALEVAAGQAARVIELLEQTGRYDPALVRRDALGWERVVAARVRAS